MKTIIKSKIKNSAIYPFLHKIKYAKLLKKEEDYKDLQSNILSGNLIVKVDNIPGTYKVDIRSHITMRILLTKQYEPEIVNLILENLTQNADVINIGANIGLFTNLAAMNINANNKVLAIEPTENAHNLLLKNIKRNNNEKKVITFKGIITDKKGTFSINTIVGKEEYSSIGNLVHDSIIGENYKTEEIEGITLDELVTNHQMKPKLLIIDVEGAEFKVLQGSVETLKKFSPIIISELDDDLLKVQNTTSKEVISFLNSLDYDVNDIGGGAVIFPFSGNFIAKKKLKS